VFRRPLPAAVPAVFATILFASAAFAANTPGRTGTFILVSAQSLEFRRDLTSSFTLWHFEKEFFIPRLRKDMAVSIGIGGKSRGGSWEVSFLHSSQIAEYEDGNRTATFQALEINGRSFVLKDFFIHPYILGGITLPFIRVSGGSFFQGKALNAAYFGAGLNAGAGLLFDIGSNILLNVGALYRWIGFLYAYGEGKGRDINYLRVDPLGPAFGRLLRTDTLTLTVGLGLIL